MKTKISTGTSVLLTAMLAGNAYAANIVTAQQGGLARWAGLAASECGIYGKRYPAVDAACYYPVDITTRPGAHEIALWDQDGKQHTGTLQVVATDFPVVDMPLPESLNNYLDVSEADAKRAAEERKQLGAVLAGSIDQPAKFSLPLGAPTDKLPPSEDDFGSTRKFTADKTSLHSGRDYPVGAGNAVKAVADGTVVLAADHFYTGNAVYVDHGAGLVSMNFHLDSLKVATGDTVKRGQTIGTIGGTGRATGPHLHLGIRWLGKRIDPPLVLDKPTALPSVSDSKQEALKKIEKAEKREPAEDDVPMDDPAD